MEKKLYPELDTPSLLVDLDVMEKNMTRMADIATKHGVKLRPHIKTHKSPWVAKQQISHGAQGITVAKISEAEVMAAGGITDILLAYPIIGRKKIERLSKLLKKIDVKLSIDSTDAADAASEAARNAGKSIEVYIDVDTGLGRMGRLPGEPTVALAKEISKRPGIEIIGVLAHAGHLMRCSTKEQLEQAAKVGAKQMVETARMLSQVGINVREVSPGFTAGARFEATVPGVTEIRPGTYVFNDSNEVYAWAADISDCAAFILTQVVSRPAPDRAIIDAGSKTLARDTPIWPDATGFGIIPDFPDIKVDRLSEEHGVLDIPPTLDLAVGDRLLIIPNHICPVVNLFDVMHGVRNNRVEREIVVSGRGMRQ